LFYLRRRRGLRPQEANGLNQQILEPVPLPAT
jgi:hypothetical protein